MRFKPMVVFETLSYKTVRPVSSWTEGQTDRGTEGQTVSSSLDELLTHFTPEVFNGRSVVLKRTGGWGGYCLFDL